LCLVAEGVETDAQLQFVRAEGVDVAQGFLLGHPMSASDMRSRLAAAGNGPWRATEGLMEADSPALPGLSLA
jgi:predicted signal transduction protein with EAL and GGDEF domain